MPPVESSLCVPSSNIQVSPHLTLPVGPIRFHCPLELTPFIARALTLTGRVVCSTAMQETLVIDAHSTQQVDFQDSGFIMQLTSFCNPFPKFHYHGSLSCRFRKG